MALESERDEAYKQIEDSQEMDDLRDDFKEEQRVDEREKAFRAERDAEYALERKRPKRKKLW